MGVKFKKVNALPPLDAYELHSAKRALYLFVQVTYFFFPDLHSIFLPYTHIYTRIHTCHLGRLVFTKGEVIDPGANFCEPYPLPTPAPCVATPFFFKFFILGWLTFAQ